MNVLVWAACGRRLSEPPRLQPELPERPEHDGLKNPDGSWQAPSTVPRGACAVDPEPSGTPPVHPEDTRAQLSADCTGLYGTDFLPDAVRVAAA